MSEAGTPAAPEAPAEARPSGCRSGCLWSCGSLLFLALLLAGGGYLAWDHWGAPFFERATNTVSGVLPGVPRPASSFGAPADEGGSESAADFPEEVWLPANPDRAAYRTTPQEALAVLTYETAPFVDFELRATKEQRRLGWKPERRQAVEGGSERHFRRGKSRLVMTVVRDGEGRQLWVRYSRSSISK